MSMLKIDQWLRKDTEYPFPLGKNLRNSFKIDQQREIKLGTSFKDKCGRIK